MFLKIAFNNLWRNKRRTVFAELAIIFGIVVIMFTGAFLKGMFRFWVDEKFVKATTGAFQVEHRDYREKSKLDPLAATLEKSAAIITDIEHLPGMLAAYGELRFTGVVSNGRQNAIFNGYGVDKDKQAQVLPGSQKFLRAGHALSDTPTDVILGRLLAEKIGAQVGDQVTLAAQTLQDGINLMYATVVGIKDGDHFDSAGYLEMNLSQVQKFLRMPDRVSQILVRADNFDRFLDYARTVESTLQHAGYPVIVRDYTEFVMMYSTVSPAFQLIAVVISVILMLIAGLGITNTMFMAVRERRKEIGTLLAIGLEAGHARRLFLLEGLLVGILGTLTGAVVAFALTTGINMHGGLTLPALGSQELTGKIIISPLMDWFVVGITFIIACAVSVFASWLPASASAQLDPVQALREA